MRRIRTTLSQAIVNACIARHALGNEPVSCMEFLNCAGRRQSITRNTEIMDRAIEAGLVERLDGDLYRLTADWRHQMDTYTERAWAKAREAKLEYDRKRRAPKIDRPCSFIFNLAAHLGVSHETT